MNESEDLNSLIESAEKYVDDEKRKSLEGIADLPGKQAVNPAFAMAKNSAAKLSWKSFAELSGTDEQGGSRSKSAGYIVIGSIMLIIIFFVYILVTPSNPDNKSNAVLPVGTLETGTTGFPNDNQPQAPPAAGFPPTVNQPIYHPTNVQAFQQSPSPAPERIPKWVILHPEFFPTSPSPELPGAEIKATPDPQTIKTPMRVKLM